MPTPTPSDATPDVYDPVSELETPALVVDLEVMERNIEEYASFAESQGVDLRSHVKTHKTPDLAHLQHRRTGGGIVCQTLGEAEVMAAAGLEDIYLSYQVVGERKLDRLVRLAGKVDRFSTTVDGPGNVEPLAAAAGRREEAVGVVLEVDVGLGRTGADPEDAPDLARLVDEQPHLDFEGILAYEAHVKGAAETEADYERLCAEAMDVAAGAVDRIEDAGVGVDGVKVGGTATSKYSGKHPAVTEINPGMYPFMDVGEMEHRPWDVRKVDCAATVITSVISAPDRDRIVVDGGSKTFGMDKPQRPVPRRRDDLTYANASEEHGWIDASDSDATFEPGDRVEFIVPHVCTTVNLHDTLIGVRDGLVEEVWHVAGRGKVK